MKILGYLMLALPFIGLFGWIAKTDGWKTALLIFLIVSAIVGWISLSVHFIKI